MTAKPNDQIARVAELAFEGNQVGVPTPKQVRQALIGAINLAVDTADEKLGNLDVHDEDTLVDIAYALEDASVLARLACTLKGDREVQ